MKKLPIKITFDSFVNSYFDKEYNEPTIKNLKIIYEQIEVNQIFGSVYIMKILGCSERTSRNLISKLREMDVIVAISGKGKGMYRFKYDQE